MTKFLNISTDNTLGGSSASDETVSSQKAVKEYVDNNSGLKNTATGGTSIYPSLTILGNDGNVTGSLNIGQQTSIAAFATAVGIAATANGYGGTAFGNSARAGSQYSTSVGYHSNTSKKPGVNSTAVGATSVSTGEDSVSVGYSAYANNSHAIAIGSGANATASNGAIQLGYGTNNSAGTFNVGFYSSSDPKNYQLLKYNGIIPIERMPYTAGENISISSTGEISATGVQDITDKITNCITEIPQDIKLELNNGTLTLKAGSKVYIPNGVGVFDVLNIQSDKTVSCSSTTGKTLIRVYPYQQPYGDVLVSSFYSGSNPSGITGMFYNTTTNKITYHENGVSDGNMCSLPIAEITVNNGQVTSIDQVFNGFGYIGSTVFALPGVKGLIPNGRNADGSLKNIEFTVDKVVTRTITWNNAAGQDLFIGKYNLNEDLQFISTGKIGQYYKQDAEPAKVRYAIWYKPSENKVYRCDLDSNGNLIWKDNFPCYIGQWFTSATSPYPITELTIKPPFRAVDWNDLEDKLNHFNNPFSLLDYKWSEYELNNASWLLSNGQFNSGATYPSVYELLLKIKNGTETKDGVSVKLSTEAYTDTDFVINTADTTFRLPIKVKLASGNRVAGNGMTLGLTDGTTNYAQTFASGSAGAYSSVVTGAYGANLPNKISSGTRPTNDTNLGVTTDPTKSGIETSSSGLKLYFYVGETIQDANVIAASNALTDIADLKAHYIVETYVNGTSWYRVYSDGWCEQGGYRDFTSGTIQTINLMKAYNNTNYTITTGYVYDQSTTYDISVRSGNKTNSSFQLVAYDKLPSSYWEAKGYIS